MDHLTFDLTQKEYKEGGWHSKMVNGTPFEVKIGDTIYGTYIAGGISSHLHKHYDHSVISVTASKCDPT